MAEKILVVDDNEDVTRITTKLLSSRGYDVLAASSGARALELAERERPDCILLDVMMPQMSGIDVLNELKKSPELATIPVILITARISDEDVLEGYKEGADYYITKPFSSDQLLYGVRLVLGQASAGARPAE
jgi:DNA-binding response OmpR family regulator